MSRIHNTIKSKPIKDVTDTKRIKRMKMIDDAYDPEQELKRIVKELSKSARTVCSQRLVRKFKTYRNIELYFERYDIFVHVRDASDDGIDCTIIELGRLIESKRMSRMS